METPRQRCARLLVALQDLADQEAASVRMKDFAKVAELQRRADPFVAELVENGPAVADAPLRDRVAAVVSLRQKTAGELQRMIDSTREKLDALQLSRNRVAQVGPVYGSSRARRPQLRAIG